MWSWVGTNLLLFLLGYGLLATGTPSSHHTAQSLGTGVALLRKCGWNRLGQNRAEKPTPHLSPGAFLSFFFGRESRIEDAFCLALFLCDMSVQRWGWCPALLGLWDDLFLMGFLQKLCPCTLDKEWLHLWNLAAVLLSIFFFFGAALHIWRCLKKSVGISSPIKKTSNPGIKLSLPKSLGRLSKWCRKIKKIPVHTSRNLTLK